MDNMNRMGYTGPMSNHCDPYADIICPVRRLVRFFPAIDGRGKWHAAFRVTGTPVCSSTATLATDGTEWISPEVGSPSASAHPILCRRCMKAATDGDWGTL